MQFTPRTLKLFRRRIDFLASSLRAPLRSIRCPARRLACVGIPHRRRVRVNRDVRSRSRTALDAPRAGASDARRSDERCPSKPRSPDADRQPGHSVRAPARLCGRVSTQHLLFSNRGERSPNRRHPRRSSNHRVGATRDDSRHQRPSVDCLRCHGMAGVRWTAARR